MSLAVLADHMASKGRNGDTMLVHMTPEEVRGLHALAAVQGGKLTINPETGLPEANFLKRMLPTIIGAAFSYFTGLPPEVVGLTVGAAETARTGDLGKGIAAGFGAYGGANLSTAFTTAGTEAIGAQAVSDAGRQAVLDRAALMGGEQGLSTVALTEPAAREAIAREAIEKASPFDKFSRGISGLADKEGRDVFMRQIGGTKGLAQTGMGILAGSSLAADKSLQANMPKTVTKFQRRSFDPYSGTYELIGEPVYGASGGLLGMAEGGVVMPPGSTSSYQRTNMSPGMLDFAQRSEPVVRMADGGTPPPLATREQVLAAYKANPLAELNPNQEAINYWMGAGLGNFNQVVQDVRAANPMLAKQIDAARAVAQPTPLNLSTAGYNYSAEPVDVSKAAIISGTAPAGYSYADAAITNPQEQQINQLYRNILNRDVEQEGLNYWMSQAQKGLSMPEIEAQIRQISRDIGVAAPTKFTTTPPTIESTPAPTLYPGTTPGVISTGEPFTPAAPTMSEVKTAYETGGGSTTMPTMTDIKPTDRTYSYNEAFSLLKGYLTANPNAQYQDVVSFARAKGIPDMQARAAYNEFRFSGMTGGTQQAYDYLMGRGKYPLKPFTPDGEIMKPYAESVLGMPVDITKKRVIFNPKTGTYEKNPAFVERKTAVDIAPIRDVSGNVPSMSTNTESYFRANPDVRAAWQAGTTGMKADEYAAFHWNTFGKKEGRKGWTEATGGGSSDTDTTVPAAKGGLMDIAAAAAARGGHVPGFDLGSYSDGGRLLRGPGDGVSDSIPATIGNKRPARLADGEFVVPARIVSELGNGSTEAGARKLYAMMDRVQAARRGSIGKGKVAKNTKADKYLPA